ncbi:MAG: hypothetical protein M5U34_12475 [Chloroflexi bacterium]|nr:hypothetical protein [Chloroflexota bacterium]
MNSEQWSVVSSQWSVVSYQAPGGNSLGAFHLLKTVQFVIPASCKRESRCLLCHITGCPIEALGHDTWVVAFIKQMKRTLMV